MLLPGAPTSPPRPQVRFGPDRSQWSWAKWWTGLGGIASGVQEKGAQSSGIQGPPTPSLTDQVLIWCCSPQEAGPRAWILSVASRAGPRGAGLTVARPRAPGIQFTRPQGLNHLHVGLLMSVCRSPTFQPHPLPGGGEERRLHPLLGTLTVGGLQEG